MDKIFKGAKPNDLYDWATTKLWIGDQWQDGESVGPHDSAVAPDQCGQGNRVWVRMSAMEQNDWPVGVALCRPAPAAF